MGQFDSDGQVSTKRQSRMKNLEEGRSQFQSQVLGVGRSLGVRRAIAHIILTNAM
ncbi:hypothetical protein HC928_23910 [bacterium]|nr:hypothetical protein [bacterium]